MMSLSALGIPLAFAFPWALIALLRPTYHLVAAAPYATTPGHRALSTNANSSGTNQPRRNPGPFPLVVDTFAIADGDICNIGNGTTCMESTKFHP